MTYGFPSGYNPFLGKRPPKVDPPPVITDAIKQTAQRQGATHLSKDGKKGYCWRLNKFYYANGPDFDSWFEFVGEELPAGELVEL